MGGCENVITIPQYSGTCWFNTFITCMFYSEGMRNILQKYTSIWKVDPEMEKGPKRFLAEHIFGVFRDILEKKYKKDNNVMNHEAYKFFEEVTPDHILQTLHKLDPRKFRFNNELYEGAAMNSYMRVLLELLNVQNVASVFVESVPFKFRNVGKFDMYTVGLPDHLTFEEVFGEKYKEADGRHYIIFGQDKAKFYVDSLMLGSFRSAVCGAAGGHAIAGVTCENDKYIYNGWTKYTVDPALGPAGVDMKKAITTRRPCELMKFNWLEDDTEFCINKAMCKLEPDTIDTKKDLCFSAFKGERYYQLVHERVYDPKYKPDLSKIRLVGSPQNIIGKRMVWDEPMKPALEKPVLECIRKRSNWGFLDKKILFDHKDFDVKMFKKSLKDQSPKLEDLLSHIEDLNEEDIVKHGKTFKHFIFTDMSSDFGVKLIGSGLISLGMKCVQKRDEASSNSNPAIKIDTAVLKDNKFKGKRFAVLTKKTLFGAASRVRLNKDIFSIYNSRPNNVYGDDIQIVVLSNDFKEGIDLFDVRYAHIFEPQISAADEKQVIGRGTRTCGQKGLEFVPNKGWALDVFVYDLRVPVGARTSIPAETLFQYYMENSGVDMTLLKLAANYEKTIALGAVDRELTRAIHDFGKPPPSTTGVVMRGSSSSGVGADQESHPITTKGDGEMGTDEWIFSVMDAVEADVSDEKSEQKKRTDSSKGKNSKSLPLVKRKNTNKDADGNVIPLLIKCEAKKCGKRPTKFVPIDAMGMTIVAVATGVVDKLESLKRPGMCAALESDQKYCAEIARFYNTPEAWLSENDGKMMKELVSKLTPKNIKVLRKKGVSALTMRNIKKHLVKEQSKIELEEVFDTDELDGTEAPHFIKVKRNVLKRFAKFKWDPPAVQSACGPAVPGQVPCSGSGASTSKATKQGGADVVKGKGKASASASVKGKDKGKMVQEPVPVPVPVPGTAASVPRAPRNNTSVAATYNNTQEFVRNYFTPKSRSKGLLLYHSVGTGKTCTGIATASNEFEKAGYNILWVTRTSLKEDVWKNMFNLVCHKSTKERLEKGGSVPGDRTAQRKLLSKSWRFNPMSYRTFQNAITGGNDIGRKLIELNGKEDPLKKTLIIIDEAHKLFGGEDLSGSEKVDGEIITEALHKSYATSGKDSAKLLLMTGTPYTNDPMEFSKILNMCKNPKSENLLPTSFADFSIQYLDSTGDFTPKGKVQFMNDIAGLVSYFNRSKDVSTFAQPRIQYRYSYMTSEKNLTVTSNENMKTIAEKLKQTKENEQRYKASNDLSVFKERDNAIKDRMKKQKELMKQIRQNSEMSKSEKKRDIDRIKDNIEIIKAEKEAYAESKKRIVDQIKYYKETTTTMVAKRKETRKSIKEGKNQQVAIAHVCHEKSTLPAGLGAKRNPKMPTTVIPTNSSETVPHPTESPL